MKEIIDAFFNQSPAQIRARGVRERKLADAIAKIKLVRK